MSRTDLRDIYSSQLEPSSWAMPWISMDDTISQTIAKTNKLISITESHLVDEKLKAMDNTAVPYGPTGWRMHSETTDGGRVSILSNTHSHTALCSLSQRTGRLHRCIKTSHLVLITKS